MIDPTESLRARINSPLIGLGKPRLAVIAFVGMAIIVAIIYEVWRWRKDHGRLD